MLYANEVGAEKGTKYTDRWEEKSNTRSVLPQCRNLLWQFSIRPHSCVQELREFECSWYFEFCIFPVLFLYGDSILLEHTRPYRRFLSGVLFSFRKRLLERDTFFFSVLSNSRRIPIGPARSWLSPRIPVNSYVRTFVYRHCFVDVYRVTAWASQWELWAREVIVLVLRVGRNDRERMKTRKEPRGDR